MTATHPAHDLPRRPLLKPGLRRTWRDANTLQLGIDPRYAVVVHDVDPAAAAFLERLDGTVPVDDASRSGANPLDRLATEHGLDPATARDLLRRLAAHGALDDAAIGSTASRELTASERDRLAPDVASWAVRSPDAGGGPATQDARRAARIDVHGAGRVGALAATLLTHAGIGELRVSDPAPLRAADVPAPWARSAPPDASAPPTRADLTLDVCEQLAPSLRTSRRRPRSARPGAASRPDVVLVAPVDTAGIVDLELRNALVRDGIPHLAAYVRETVGVVGPLVLPGRTPCLRCIDLARTDLDPAWPRVLAQLDRPLRAGRRTSAPPAAPDACDGVLAAAVAAQAAAQVLAVVDGLHTLPPGTSVEIDLTDGLTRCRRWQVHPACGCTWT